MTPKEIRLMKKFTNLEMSKKLGISISTYRLKEKGDYRFTLKEMSIIANIGGVSIDDMEV